MSEAPYTASPPSRRHPLKAPRTIFSPPPRRTPPGFDPRAHRLPGVPSFLGHAPATHGEPRWGSASYAASPLSPPANDRPAPRITKRGTGNQEPGTSSPPLHAPCAMENHSRVQFACQTQPQAVPTSARHNQEPYPTLGRLVFRTPARFSFNSHIQRTLVSCPEPQRGSP